MRLPVYAALIAAVAAAECTDTDVEAAKKADVDTFKALDDAKKLKTADVTAFETEYDKANAHILEQQKALDALKKAETPDAAKITEAEGNLKIAEASRDAIIKKEKSADHNKILLDIDAKQKAYDDAVIAKNKANSYCVPAEIKAYNDEMIKEWKTKKEYEKLSVDDKKKFDDGIAEKMKKIKEMDGKIRYQAEYFKMTQAEKDMYNKILIAQKKQKKEEMDKKQAEMEKKMAADGYDKMSDEKKKAYLARMKMMKTAIQDRLDDNEKSDMEAKNKFGFMKMDSKKKALFEAYQKKLKGSRDVDEKSLMDRLKKYKESAEFKALSDEKKAAVMKDKLAGIKEMLTRKTNWRKDDDDQRKKANYFGMKDAARKVFDDKQDAFKKKMGQFTKAFLDDEDMTKKRLNFKNMTPEKQKYFKQMWTKKMGDGDKQRMYQRGSDNDKRIKTDYYNRSKANRDEYDRGLENARGMKYGMDKSKTGEAGSNCGKSAGPQQGGKQGPPQRRQPKGGKGGPGGPGGPGGYGRCAEGLCCGKVSQTGLYQEDYTICGAKNAVSYKGMSFKCLQGAQYLYAGTAALLSAAYMMA